MPLVVLLVGAGKIAEDTTAIAGQGMH